MSRISPFWQIVLSGVILVVVGWGFLWIMNDSNARLKIHDHHYCVDIEGHTEQECMNKGRGIK